MKSKHIKLLTILSLAAMLSVCIVGATIEDSEDSDALVTNATASVGTAYSGNTSTVLADPSNGTCVESILSSSVTCSTSQNHTGSASLYGLSGTLSITGSDPTFTAKLTITGTPTTAGTVYVNGYVTYNMYDDYDATVGSEYVSMKIVISSASYTHTLNYNANGGSGAPSTQTVTDSSTTTSMTISSTTPTRSGYTFLGWSTSSSATSASHSAGGTISVGTSAVTLYAVWQQITYTHTLNYNANGGSGAPSTQTVTNTSSTYSMTISGTIPTRSGYTFLGWSTSSSATSAGYSSGGTISVGTTTKTLYAVWEQATISVSGTPEDAALVGSSYSYTPAVSVSGCTLAVDGASWLTVSGSSLIGTPTEAGTYEITLTASKSGYTSATQTFTVVVVSVLSFESSPTGGVIAYAV